MDLTNELKRERKMFMAIKDPNMAHFYIDVDFDKAQELIDLNRADEVPYKVRELLKHKDRQTKEMMQKLSLVRINYIYNCLKTMN